jgi:chromodomain-helicase-DNA-binding protein 4
MELRKTRGFRAPNYSDAIPLVDSDEDDELNAPRRLRQTRLNLKTRAQGSTPDSSDEGMSLLESDEEDQPRRSKRGVAKSSRSWQTRLSLSRHNHRSRLRDPRSASSDDSADEEERFPSDGEDDYSLLQSDVLTRPSKKRRISRKDGTDYGMRSYDKLQMVASRRSDRATRGNVNMEEVGEGEIFRSDSDESAPAPPKASGAREAFKALPRGNKFRERHSQICDTCTNSYNSSGALVYCQGCTVSYHKACLGPRNGREHLVTKVGDDDFVLQCRRCVNVPMRKDPTAPDLSKCTDCNELGPSCAPFRKTKTSAQEQKEREENNGEDPIANVESSLINNHKNVLFRCTRCCRAFHFHHLPSLSPSYMDLDQDDDERTDARFSEYTKDWMCKDCVDAPPKVGALIAWRPDDVNNYTRGQDVSVISEDHKEYLIKWENLSYFRARWMPGAWTWGVIASAMRRAFFSKTLHPKMRTEDAIPEEWLRIDIVLNVKYTNLVDIHEYEIDKARIKEVAQALIKYKGLGYEDAVWEDVPGPDDGDRWTDFVIAYEDWVLGRYTTPPSISNLKNRMEKIRSKPFKEKVKQPENLIGGELMKYQLDGLNWLYYQWYQQKSGILADEMGLGKTIQIIAFLAMMVTDLKCFPFLIVVPNSTCANWRREIKQWAPQLRVVAYFGSSTARKMAYDHELFPEGSKSLRCHAVITSYDAATEDSSKRFFRRVQWQGLIVDEGQRLKNDQSQLHTSLNGLRIPFRILLTGTPLQNNARELFNLLQFLDDSIDASKMEEEFAEMTNEKISELHSLIRPFILRRTKLQVLTFLPAMAQIILPVSMSVLQKKTYKGILAQRPELLRSLFSTTGLKSNERVGLNNILMQLRKCLCHPFVFNQSIEERELDHQVTHKNLVEASSKLQLLELLLPKLQERGHRILIFSQFLDMLSVVEDFLEGMSLPYQRLDGRIDSLEKQKRIDEFNAPNSSLFAFLLSTRAGGVGINLATADTVIILDPDFNPHQDIQAISRAHRIGQTKKVLCFQLMTRNSAEEKIMQIGRKKMALDEVVINQMDEDDVEERDMEHVLKHGMAELFNDDNPEQSIHYDETSIEKLLDRSQIENTKSEDTTAESQFGFARIWANDDAALQEALDVSEKELQAPDPSFWEKILKEREAKAAARAAKEELGRGKRQRQTVQYNSNVGDRNVEAMSDGDDDGDGGVNGPTLTPLSAEKRSGKRRRQANPGDSDTDFQASEADEVTEDEGNEPVTPKELDISGRPNAPSGAILGPPKNTRAIRKFYHSLLENLRMVVNDFAAQTFARTTVKSVLLPPSAANGRSLNGKPYPQVRHCPACNQQHFTGSCPLKTASVELCNICGLAHYGYARVCPHFRSETMVRTMLDALKQSPEPKYLVDQATKYLRGLKGSLVQEKKRALERSMAGFRGPSYPDAVQPNRALNGVAAPGDGASSWFPPQQYQPPLQPAAVPWEQLPIEDRLKILTSG